MGIKDYSADNQGKPDIVSATEPTVPSDISFTTVVLRKEAVDSFRLDPKTKDLIIALKVKAVGEAEAQMIDSLFPHLSEQVYHILNQEALLAALKR